MPSSHCLPQIKLKTRTLTQLVLLTLGWTSTTYAQTAAFTDHFTHGIDTLRWMMPTRAWGGDNGGVNTHNVVWQGSKIPEVKLNAQGDNYQGPMLQNANRLTRVGAALVTQQSLEPGTVQVCARLPQALGVASAFWLYDYHTTGTDTWVNEIDWETPTDWHQGGAISYDFARANSWGGQIPGDDDGYSGRVDLKAANGGINPSADGQYHLYSITWRARKTDSMGHITPGYISWGFASSCQAVPQEVHRYNGKAQGIDNVPIRPMALWLGLWFPAASYQSYVGWAGNPDFTETALAIRFVTYTPAVENER